MKRLLLIWSGNKVEVATLDWKLRWTADKTRASGMRRIHRALAGILHGKLGELFLNWRVAVVQCNQCEALLLQERMLALSGPTKTVSVQAVVATHAISVQADEWNVQTNQEHAFAVICQYLELMFAGSYQGAFLLWKALLRLSLA